MTNDIDINKYINICIDKCINIYFDFTIDIDIDIDNFSTDASIVNSVHAFFSSIQIFYVKKKIECLKLNI